MARKAVDKDGFIIEDDFFTKDQMKKLANASKKNASASKTAKKPTKSTGNKK